MNPSSFDPGLTQTFAGKIRRTIERDGSFNVHRIGRLRDRDLYLKMINGSWTRFFSFVVAAFLVTNLFFATVYYMAGEDKIEGTVTNTGGGIFLRDFFFSVHTLTTVGYGNVVPHGFFTNMVAALEALTGLLGFAVATGMLYGRFSRPAARILYSEKALIAPYQGITSLQFRIANRRSNELMELEASVLLMTVIGPPEALRRDYKLLNLERRTVFFFPLTWTIVHPIDEDSPLYGKTADDLAQAQTEFLILIKGFDDTFSQAVHSRYSYRHEDLVWNAKFSQAFSVNDQGEMVLDLPQVSSYTTVPAAIQDSRSAVSNS
jgi:inward rectifier potassium channel